MSALSHFAGAVAAAFSLLAITTPCQGELTEAIQHLDQPDRRDRAIAELVQAGDSCVPLLIPLLERSGDADEPSAMTLCAALEVLAELGAAARAAMPAMLSAYRFASDVSVRNQAVWSIAEVGPAAGDKQLCEEHWRLLRQDRTATLDMGILTYANWRLSYGPQPSFERLSAALDQSDAVAIWAAARSSRLRTDPPRELLETMQARLAQALMRSELPWRRDRCCDLATGDLATTLLQNGVPLAHVARGLLQARSPGLRRQALQSLGPARWSAQERLDLVRLLWDPDRETRELVAGSLLALGSQGLVGLRALRAFEAFEDSASRPRLAAYYRRCAERMVAGAATDGEVAAELAQRADAALRGVSVAQEPITLDDAARALLTTIVVGCRGADDDAPSRLAELARAAGALPFRPSDPLRNAFLALLDSSSLAKWSAGVRALAVLGPTAAPDDPDDLGELLLESTVGSPILGTWALFPAEARIRAGAGADAAQLRTALGSRRWHVALHAAVELLARGELTADDGLALDKLSKSDVGEMRTWTGPEFATLTGTQPLGSTFLVPGRVVHAIGALCQTAIGERPWLDGAIAADLRRYCGIDPDADLGATLEAARAAGTLAQLAQKVERDAWEELQWPVDP